MRLYSFVFLFLLCSGMQGQASLEQAGLLYEKYLAAKDAGHFHEAEALLEEILLYGDVLPDYNISLIYNGLGTVSYNLGKYQEARLYYDQAHCKCPDSDLRSQFLMALILNNQAILHKQIGELYNSLDYYQEAENALMKIDKHDIQYLDQLSMIYLNRALVLYKLQQYIEAIDLFHKSHRIRSRNNLSALGSIYYNLARCYQEIHEYALSEEYYRKSIEQWILDYDSSYYELGNVYLEYGLFQINQGDHAQGLDNYLHALNIYLANYGPNHTYTASGYNLLGDFFREKSDFRHSLVYLQKALNSICPGFNDDNIYSNPKNVEALLDTRLLKIYRSKCKTLVRYANSVEETNQDSTIAILNFALETNKEAIKVLHRIQQSYLTQESRLYLAENQQDLFVEGIEVALLLHNLAGKFQYIEEAYKFALLGKTLELSFEQREKEKLYLESLHDSISTALLELKEDIDAYSNLIQMEQTLTTPDSMNLSTWKNRRFELRRDYESLYKEMFGNLSTPGFESVDFTKESLSDLQSKLRRNESVVEYATSNRDPIGNRKLFVFIISRNDCKVYQSNLDTTFSKDIQTVSTYLGGYDPLSAQGSLEAELEYSLISLYESIIEPIEHLLSGPRLYVIPDDNIAQIPFDALLKTEDTNGSVSTGHAYLIKEYEISYAPNSSFITRQKIPIFKRRPQIKVIAQDYVVNVMEDEESRFLYSVSDETDSVLSILKGWRIPVSYSKKEILNEIENGELLHFSLHSSPSDKTHPSAYMVIKELPDTALNHLLFDYEIDPLRLSTKLVVINACESGSGELYRGEGMLSLSRSFMLAGAKSVAHTLWPVDDRASLKIITEFYTRISKGWDKSESLREAKLKYLAKSSPSFSHPYYWAGYQLVGDTSAIIYQWTKLIIVGAAILGIAIMVIVRIRFKRRSY